MTVLLDQPETGWTATFVEAQIKDGWVVTSPVYITPDEVYPERPATSSIPACQIIGG